MNCVQFIKHKEKSIHTVKMSFLSVNNWEEKENDKKQKDMTSSDGNHSIYSEATP